MNRSKISVVLLPLLIVIGCDDSDDDFTSENLRSCEYVSSYGVSRLDIDEENVKSCATFSGSNYDFMPYRTTGLCTSDMDEPSPVSSCARAGSTGECVMFKDDGAEIRFRYYLNNVAKERGICLSDETLTEATVQFIED